MKITTRTHILFIALLIVVVFSPSLKNDFVWDDKYLIIDNPNVKSYRYIPKIFTEQLYEGSRTHSNFYRPFQTLSFLIDYSIWGANPYGYHLTNLFMHIFNASLVYLILITIGSSSGLALLISILFGISPTISGVTYYISARSDLLMAIFIFLSFLLFAKYIKNKNRKLYIFSIILFIFALLSKEMAIMLLAFLILEIFKSREKIRQGLILLLPYLMVLFFYIMLRFSILNFAQGANPLIDFSYPVSIPLWRRILTDFKIIPQYLRILLFPYDLHMEWFIEPAKSIFEIDILFSIVVVILLVFFVKRLSRIHSLILFGALWFLLGLLPVLNIYPISVFFGEGWLYVPSIGFFIICGILFESIIKPKVGKIFSTILVVIFVVYYSFFTISYGRVWRDPISLFKNILKYEEESPFSFLTYNNLAMAYYNKRDLKKAIEFGEKSIALSRDYPDAYNNLGICYMTAGKPIKAIKYFKKAISLKKDYVSGYNNLAHAYNEIGLEDNAIKFLKIALNKDPDYYKLYCNLGYIYSDRGDLDKAIGFFKKAADLERGFYDAHYGLGHVYKKNNRFKEALDEYEKARELGLRDYAFYNELAFLYIEDNRYKDAEDLFRQSLVLNSDQAEPHNNLGNLYSMFGYFNLAIKEYKKALGKDPCNLGIFDNIKKTKLEWKKALKKARISRNK